jgi:chromosome segregation ATPase
MIEWIMNFGIGFLAATLLGLLFLPAVHNRAVRLTMKRLEASAPTSLAEIRADKDQLRAEFAVLTRRFEIKIEKLKAQTTRQLAELGKKTDSINQLKKDLAEKNVMNVALETRIKPLRDQLRAAEEELQRRSNALVEAGRRLAENQAELAKVWRELGERALVA